MINLFSKVKNAYKKIRGFFPEALPTGMPEFNKFVDDLMATYWMPTASRDDIVFVVTSTIIRFQPTEIFCSKWYFAKVIRAAGSKQIAGANFQEVKLRQQAQAQKQQAEATASQAASDVATKNS